MPRRGASKPGPSLGSALARFDAITIEGALLSPDTLARVARRVEQGQSDADYAIPRGLALRDEVARYFRMLQGRWGRVTGAGGSDPAPLRRELSWLLSDVFGFTDLRPGSTAQVGGRTFPLTFSAGAGRVPIVAAPAGCDIDTPCHELADGTRRRSATLCLQEYLNAEEGALWGLAVSATRIRLLRDNASLTRPAHIEADLARIVDGELFADFAALWLLIHVSRFGAPGTPVAACPMERWREAARDRGVAARERLRAGFEQALATLGQGFLAHLANDALRALIRDGDLTADRYFHELLRLVYRMIFLFTAEERALLHPPDPAGRARRQRALYAEGYALGRLRARARRYTARDRHYDLYEGLKIVFRALAEEGEERLALPALGGIFAGAGGDLLDGCTLPNRALLGAVFHLSWLHEEAALVRVNWRDMETEELGSVYEALLELAPRVVDDGRGFAFAAAGAAGGTKKSTGSYYTPDSLVQPLLDSALDPVMERAERESADPVAALLNLAIVDPAAGSGHFLLAAGRRLAERVTRARHEGAPGPEAYRQALREVARNCLYGVDRNPLAVELCKVALWIETVEPGKPLGFLDANIRHGDSLIGVFDLQVLEEHIPKAAYQPLTGDDKDVARMFQRSNAHDRPGQVDIEVLGAEFVPQQVLQDRAARIHAMAEDSREDIATKEAAFAQLAEASSPHRAACDLWCAAFLAPKTPRALTVDGRATVPTSAAVWAALDGRLSPQARDLGRQSAHHAAPFHWPLEFPQILLDPSRGGFDVVLGNPPWERIKLQEKEFFASRAPEIAAAANAAARRHAIAQLAEAGAGSPDRALHEAYLGAKRSAEAASLFARHAGRYPLTGRGDTNLYALFAELAATLPAARGRAGIIVPTGIATDATTAPFFAGLNADRRLVQLVDFENRKAIFPAVHRSYKFCLLTLGREVAEARFAFYLTQANQWLEPERRFTLTPDATARINPNTHTAPVFRSRADAELTAKIYANCPVLIDDNRADGNPWGIRFMTMFHMSNDSGLFRTAAQLLAEGARRDDGTWVDRHGTVWLPLYEAKMMHHYDHRWGSYTSDTKVADVDEAAKRDPGFEVTPRYWVPEPEVDARVSAKHWHHRWLMGWRKITNATNERTVIAGLMPLAGFGDSLQMILSDSFVPPPLAGALFANLTSLIMDYVARQKIGGTNFNFFLLRQLPILPPDRYDGSTQFIVDRFLELTYTSHALTPLARDLGCAGPPFPWDPNRRALLRAELDAWYARAYGLTRDELRYILDPADIHGPDYPSETFRTLKHNEQRRYGEYRTRRLILAAWDRLHRGDLC